jgi:hypothetical protein
MAFSIDARSIPHLSSYAQALEYYNETKPFRSDPYSRPLAERRAKHKRMAKHSNGDIACILHNPAVVTYHPDDSITLRPYASISTDAFANALLRNTHITTHFSMGYLVGVRGRLYRADRSMLITKADEVSGTLPFRHAQLNIKKLNAALKRYDFAAFKDWVLMTAQLWPKEQARPLCASQHFASRIASGPEHWVECLVVDALRWQHWVVNVDETLTRARILIAKTEQCIDITEKPYLETWNEYQAVKRGEKYR